MVEIKRMPVQIPQNTEAYKYLFENSNHKGLARWEVIEEMVKQLPKSKQDRAYKLFCTLVDEFEILYPGTKNEMMVLWVFISKRIMKLPDLDGKEVLLDHKYFDLLEKV